jgi:NAD(P)-dependent dehydrogenase (short-subunit alcohol dehydrogenase family)
MIHTENISEGKSKDDSFLRPFVDIKLSNPPALIMSARDPRVANVDNFTARTHSKPTATTDAKKVHLPSPCVVCVIGASRGIGEGVALSYAKAGASGLVLAARSIDQLQAVEENIKHVNPKIQTVIHHCDITNSSSVQKLAQHVQTEFGRLDVLVVNSGYSGAVELKITEGDPNDGQWRQAFDVNAIGTYYSAHYFIPLLLSSENGAKAFLAVGSIAACIRRGIIANSKYCISKMAQARIVEHVAEQFGDDGILAVRTLGTWVSNSIN